MDNHTNGPIRGEDSGVVLGVDGGTTNTVCVCLPYGSTGQIKCLSRAVAGCSNRNSVGENAAMETLENVMKEALSMAGRDCSEVWAVCLAVSGVNHPSDQRRLLDWLRYCYMPDYSTYIWFKFYMHLVHRSGLDTDRVQVFWCPHGLTSLGGQVRGKFPSHAKFYVENDSVAALASGTMGKLHGCVLIAGTGAIAYGITEDGREARAAGAGPILGDWGSGYGIAAQALTAVIKAHDGRGPLTSLTNNILKELQLSSPDEVIGWTYADASWARIAALVPVVVSSAIEGDDVANKILHESVRDLSDSVIAVVRRLQLCGEDGKGQFPLVMVGGVLESNKKWDIGKEVTKCISKVYPGVNPIQPEVEPAVGAALLAWHMCTKEGKTVQNGT